MLNFFMSPITVWFWARLAAVGPQDFASTPAGLSLYFFARIEGHSITVLSKFMAVASAINFLWFNYLLLPLRADPRLGDYGLEHTLGGIIYHLLSIICMPIRLFYGLVRYICMFSTAALMFGVWLLSKIVASLRNFNLDTTSSGPDLRAVTARDVRRILR